MIRVDSYYIPSAVVHFFQIVFFQQLKIVL